MSWTWIMESISKEYVDVKRSENNWIYRKKKHVERKKKKRKNLSREGEDNNVFYGIRYTRWYWAIIVRYPLRCWDPRYIQTV